MISDIVTCTYNKLQKFERTELRFQNQFNLWKTNIINKYFYVKLEQPNGVTVKLVDYYTKNNIEGVRIANEFIYFSSDAIYIEKLDNYVMMIPVLMFTSYDDFYFFDQKISELINSLEKYLIIDDPSPILISNVIDLQCSLDSKVNKCDSEIYFNGIVDTILPHVYNTEIHLCRNERETWNEKLTPDQAYVTFAVLGHVHDYAQSGLQCVTINSVTYNSQGNDCLNMVGTGLSITVTDNVITFNI